ncbi:MAG: DUF3365 domain-containing protein [Cryomorphaceae bacterium]|nr:MAG: DUF3365 domain-containing protein [Cryomorphaceae bacterium]
MMKQTTYVVLALVTSMFWACEGDAPSSSAIVDEAALKEKGKEVVMATGKALIGAVQQSMGEGGIAGAVSYCNVKALPITDSLAARYGVEVKRTALRVRNPQNRPTDNERTALLRMGASAEPAPELVALEDGQYAYYHPIMLQAFCQACHGAVESFSFETDSIIRHYYPDDEAVGFAEGDLRGMWAVYFN